MCRTALNKTGIPGYRYCMNPYVGCAHGCLYCYASFMCRFTGHREKWGEFVDVKVNFPDVLARQLERSRSHPEGKVLIGTVTDAGIGEILMDHLNPYPAVVHRMKAAYREHFPDALPDLESYLESPGIYREMIGGRVDHLGGIIGCRPDFV